MKAAFFTRQLAKRRVAAAQAIGATTPVFTAILAIIMLRKSEVWIVYAALLPVVIGIVIATGAVRPAERLMSVSSLVRFRSLVFWCSTFYEVL